MRPGWKLDWREGREPDEIVVRVIPDRAELGRRLLGRAEALSPERDFVGDVKCTTANLEHLAAFGFQHLWDPLV